MKNLYSALQDSIYFDGEEYKINTDFRIWLKIIKGEAEDLTNIFIGSSPCFYFCGKLFVPDEVNHALENFFYNRNETDEARAGVESNQNKLIDFDLDSDYIYASFMQAYGIDIIDIDYLHWHKFLALLNGLPETTIIKRIIEFRGYEGNDKDWLKLKQAYALPRNYTEQEKELDEYFESVWG